MAYTSIIKFLTGTTRQLQPYLNGATAQQYIAFNKTTGELWWNHQGTKYYLKCAPDWAQSDSTASSYIKNKPSIPTVDDLIEALDVKDLNDSLNLVSTFRQLIDPQQVIPMASGKRLLQLTSKRMPTRLITPNKQYQIEPQSTQIAQDNTLTIDLSPYLAYQNTTVIPANSWYLLYS